MSVPPPNPALQELADLLGEGDTRELVRAYLQELGGSLRLLATASPEEQKRIVHGLKTSSRHMGAETLARSLTSLETRLNLRLKPLDQETLGQLAREFDRVTASLRPFAVAATADR